MGSVVHGHIHPCLRWGGQAAPCYLLTSDRLVLPAFSTDAAGVNVLGDRRWSKYQCQAIVGGEVLDFGRVGEMRRRLVSDASQKRGG
jgi:metallophosphoesterase superfamily enzyme